MKKAYSSFFLLPPSSCSKAVPIPNVSTRLQYSLIQDVDQWNFDTFSLAVAAEGSPMKYIGKESLQISI